MLSRKEPPAHIIMLTENDAPQRKGSPMPKQSNPALYKARLEFRRSICAVQDHHRAVQEQRHAIAMQRTSKARAKIAELILSTQRAGLHEIAAELGVALCAADRRHRQSMNYRYARSMRQ